MEDMLLEIVLSSSSGWISDNEVVHTVCSDLQFLVFIWILGMHVVECCLHIIVNYMQAMFLTYMQILKWFKYEFMFILM